ncbi:MULTISPECIES: hypothetical protein [unclassified Bradyrhizobium]|uniref:hypothetical protein n=1 Tax=unclassified Bradyrhizobium TaxID=2631580 RepID=UPI0028EED6DC|nr:MULTISPECIES: hypothetical protein [unclassified Bradyrhizobium]
MKPSTTMLTSPAYAALGGSGRSVLRVILEEIDAPSGAAQLSTVFFLQAGLSATAVMSGVPDLIALGFIKVTGKGTATREFASSDGWTTIVDKAEAERRLAEARATAQRPARRRSAAAATEKLAVDEITGRLPDGIRRSVYP